MTHPREFDAGSGQHLGAVAVTDDLVANDRLFAFIGVAFYFEHQDKSENAV